MHNPFFKKIVYKPVQNFKDVSVKAFLYIFDIQVAEVVSFCLTLQSQTKVSLRITFALIIFRSWFNKSVFKPGSRYICFPRTLGHEQVMIITEVFPFN